MKLYPFQKIGARWIAGRERGLIASEMGTGKSFQILAALRKLTLGCGSFRILIVAPASLCPMWDEMLGDWFPDGNARIVSSSCPPWPGGFTVCSYHYLHRKQNLRALLKTGSFDFIVCDEAHKMKTWSSLTTRAFRRLIRHHQGRLWMLTGTPASATGSDYYPYLKLLHDNPDQFGTLSEFRERYCEEVWDFWSQCLKYQGVKEDMRGELQAHLRTFSIRHRKKDVLKELPAMQIQKVPISVDRAIVKQAQAVVARFNYAGDTLDPAVATVVRTTGLGKVPAAVDWISGTRQPLVVFAIHTEVILKLEAACIRMRRRVATITGKTPPKKRHEIVKAFQAGELDVVVCNMQAGGEGITLTRANTVLFVEESWKPDLVEQAMARVHRISQKASSVHCVHLWAKGTIDDAIWANRKKKLEFLKEVLND